MSYPKYLAGLGAGAMAVAMLASCTGNLPNVVRDQDKATTSSTPGADPGSVTLHRLNKAEYNNTVRDLLGSKLTPADAFTSDPTANGFDNNADALTLSTPDLQNYEAAAEALAAELLSAQNANKLATLAPCADTNVNTVSTCIRDFVTDFGRHAWRRPLTNDEVITITTLGMGQSTDTYAQRLETVLVGMLVSPHFIFRVELDPDPNSATVHDLSAYELVTRLSYFLWSSTPDDTLLDAAANGSILTDAGLKAQVTRMLADTRAAALTQNFAGQWLQLRDTMALQPDPTLFPTWDENLRTAMVLQSQMVFLDLLSGAEPLSSLFTSDTTYLNDRLARHYGLPLPGSSTMQKAPAGDRKGLLTQAAVLAATSFPGRTSLVRRGEMVMAELLCSPPPPAPPNVPQLPSNNGNIVTQRQRLEAHATSASCAACHSLMDPYGFVLEPFDAIGAKRTTDNGGTIDPTSKLQDGTPLNSVDDLTKIMATDVRVPNCMVQKLLTYALGRTVGTTDAKSVSTLQSNFLNDDQRINPAHLRCRLFRRVSHAPRSQLT